MGEITPLRWPGSSAHHSNAPKFLQPTSKARAKSLAPLTRKRKSSSSYEEAVAEWPGADREVLELFDPQVLQPTQWLEKLLSLTPEERNAFVVAWVIEKVGEMLVGEAATKSPRWSDVGVVPQEAQLGPRKSIQLLQSIVDRGVRSVDRIKKDVDVSSTVAMISGVAKSAKSYASGLRAYGSFCNLLGQQCHFPTTEELAIQYHFFFGNAATYTQYLKHLRFAHHLLRLEVDWYTRAVKQVEKGVAKIRLLPQPKPALTAEAVKKLVRTAALGGDSEFVVIALVARLFMLRVPSECLPLELRGGAFHCGVRGSRGHYNSILEKRFSKACYDQALLRLCIGR